jgi:4-carboxymuconolactone decarboxylase
LVTEHQVNQALYHRAVATFGEKGVVDMIYLAGNYVTTCALLNTFTIPAPVGAKTEDL